MLALARRRSRRVDCPDQRSDAERDLCFLGPVAMFDPPRPEVADAVARCHSAGIRVLVVTGDHPLTASDVARQIGIGEGGRRRPRDDLDAMSESELDGLLGKPGEIVFARTSPEAKLRIADALRSMATSSR